MRLVSPNPGDRSRNILPSHSPCGYHGGMSEKRDKIFLVLFAIYVAILVVATIGELFQITFILDLLDLKKLFTV